MSIELNRTVYNKRRHDLNFIKMSCDEDYLYALRLQNELDALDENQALAEVSIFFLFIHFKIIMMYRNFGHAK